MKRRLLITAVALFCSVALIAQERSISTNIVDMANLGTLNAEVQYGLARRWTASGEVKYNPFSFPGGKDDLGMQNRQRSVAAGLRFWPWHIYSGWWMSGRVRYQEYNVAGLRDSKATEGDRYGGGLAGGYTYMLGKNWNLDMGLGFWAGRDNFTVYACPTCGRLLDTGSKTFVLPDDFIFALTYVF